MSLKLKTRLKATKVEMYKKVEAVVLEDRRMKLSTIARALEIYEPSDNIAR